MKTLLLRHAQFACLLLSTAVAIGLAGCAQVGLAAPQTVTEKIASAQVARNEIGASTTVLLNASKITSKDAENSLKVADTATEGIALARTLAAQDPTAANAKLSMITTTLAAIKGYLAVLQTKP